MVHHPFFALLLPLFYSFVWLLPYNIYLAGVYNAEVPPVPIPNTVVKLSRAEDTWRAAAW